MIVSVFSVTLPAHGHRGGQQANDDRHSRRRERVPHRTGSHGGRRHVDDWSTASTTFAAITSTTDTATTNTTRPAGTSNAVSITIPRALLLLFLLLLLVLLLPEEGLGR